MVCIIIWNRRSAINSLFIELLLLISIPLYVIIYCCHNPSCVVLMVVWVFSLLSATCVFPEGEDASLSQRAHHLVLVLLLSCLEEQPALHHWGSAQVAVADGKWHAWCSGGWLLGLGHRLLLLLLLHNLLLLLLLFLLLLCGHLGKSLALHQVKGTVWGAWDLKVKEGSVYDIKKWMIVVLYHIHRKNAHIILNSH